MTLYGILHPGTGKPLGIWGATYLNDDGSPRVHHEERSVRCSPAIMVGEHRGADMLFCTARLDHAMCLVMTGVGHGSQPYTLLQVPHGVAAADLRVVDLATGIPVETGEPSPELAEYLAKPHYLDVRQG